MNLADEAHQVMQSAAERIQFLTQELSRVTADRDRQLNFRLFFQREALKYRDKYHLSVEALTLERLNRD